MYTTWGKTRGDCGHAHRTREVAERCADRDARACEKQGAGNYSDRAVRVIANRAGLDNYDTTRGPGTVFNAFDGNL